MKSIVITIALLISALSWAQFPNVHIGSQGYACEPSIMVDPNDPSRVMAASVLDNYYFSSDTGLTWKHGILKSEWGVWGDPVIDVDTQGSFYFFHLSNYKKGDWIDRIVCQRTDDNGKNWPIDSYTGKNGAKAQDKHWTVIDRTNDKIHMTWTQFDKYDSDDPKDRSNIMYSQSSDRGHTWTEAKIISTDTGDCLDDDKTVEGATPAIGPNGEIYVAWAGPEGLVFKRSEDDGLSWTDDEILVDEMPGGWAMDIPAIYRCNGMPVTKCDLSGGKHHGRIYICWADQRKGVNDTEVWLKFSDDKGDSWSAAHLVNDKTIGGSHQFFPWMDIDQANGDLYFVYYDRLANEIGTYVNMALSRDGGDSFFNFRLTDRVFVPDESVFFGDYNNISAHNGVVRPIWTSMEDKKTSIWSAFIPQDLATRCLSRKKSVDMVFELPKRKKVKFYWGNTIKRDLRVKKMKKKYDAGRHTYTLPLAKQSQGTFYYRLKVGKKIIAKGDYYLNQ